MKTIYGETIQQSDEQLALVRRANQQLQKLLGQSADLVTAEWDLGTDERKRPVITLRLSDWTGAVTAEFAPDELAKPMSLDSRLYRLWGDLLQDRSHKQLEHLLKSVESASES
jgi:hypothetical protein